MSGLRQRTCGPFVKEDRRLALLRRQNIIRVPRVIACTIVGRYQILLLEWIEEGLRSANFWQTFGEQLAHLYRVTADNFGLEQNNYMGALPQDNTPEATWVEFFIRRRLEPRVRLAVDRQLLDKTTVQHFERLYPILPSLFPTEPPSLLHGDLWSGNFLCDALGNPVLIDPAVYGFAWTHSLEYNASRQNFLMMSLRLAAGAAFGPPQYRPGDDYLVWWL